MWRTGKNNILPLQGRACSPAAVMREHPRRSSTRRWGEPWRMLSKAWSFKKEWDVEAIHNSSSMGKPSVELGVLRIILETGLIFINLKVYTRQNKEKKKKHTHGALIQQTSIFNFTSYYLEHYSGKYVTLGVSLNYWGWMTGKGTTVHT